MEPVRFGVIGVGGMGGSHARSFKDIEEATLVAVADVSAQTAAKVAEETGATAYATAEELIEKGNVEAIIIATPHFFHPPVAEFAAKHGVHVLSEKPISVTVSAADGMIAACKEGGVMLGVVFQQRLEAVRVHIKSMVDSGVLGKLHRISMVAPWYRPQAYYGMGAWRGTWKGEGGGILMNQAPHSLDQFIWLAGRSPLSLQALAFTRLHNIEVENSAQAICDFGDGMTGYFYASTSEVPSGERLEIAGDKGILSLDGRTLRFYELESPISEHLATATGGFDTPKGEWKTVEYDTKGGGHPDVTRAFARAVRAGDSSLMVANGKDGLKAVELANAILMAGYTRKEVTLPLDRVRYDSMLAQLQSEVPVADLNV